MRRRLPPVTVDANMNIQYYRPTSRMSTRRLSALKFLPTFYRRRGATLIMPIARRPRYSIYAKCGVSQRHALVYDQFCKNDWLLLMRR